VPKNPVFDYDTLHTARISLAERIAATWAERLNGALVAGEGCCDLVHDANCGVVNEMAVAELLRLAKAAGVEITSWATGVVGPATLTRLEFVAEIAPPERTDNVLPLFPRGTVH
jgi:hypothetical protein